MDRNRRTTVPGPGLERRAVGIVLAAVAALVLSACASPGPRSIQPLGPCGKVLILDGQRYVPGDPETNVRQGEPVSGATIRDECQGSDAPAVPVEAWRAMGYRGDGLVTVDPCTRPSPGASPEGCVDAPEFDLWVPDVPTP